MKKWQKNHKIYADYQLIDTVIIDRPTNHKDWSLSKYEALKKKIKFHYSVVQNDACAYCREPIRFDGYGEPIEHIVPKNIAPEWMFEAKNLCISCYGCNTKKSVTNTLLKPYNAGDSYPTTSKDISIVHPHFDSFSASIATNELLFKAKGKGDKGINTINLCKLNRPDLLFTRALNMRKSSNTMLAFAFKTLRSGKVDIKEREVARDFILALLKRLKYSKRIDEELKK